MQENIIHSNPFHEASETKRHPNSRALRTTFWQKMSDTFYSFAGSFFSKKNHIGLFDYLTLSIPFQISKFAYWCLSNTSNPAAVILLIPAVLIALSLAGVRYGLGALFTLLVSPFVGIAHAISKIQGDPSQK